MIAMSESSRTCSVSDLGTDTGALEQLARELAG